MVIPEVFQHSLSLLVLAIAIETAVGYPFVVYHRVGHPVTWIGRLLGLLDRLGNAPERSPAYRRLAGAAAILSVIVLTGGIAYYLQSALLGVSVAGVILCALLASSLLAQRSLHEHVARVASSLEEGGLAAGREAVSKIVGRNPEWLDEAGVARASIESLAENFSDGVVAPAFWIAVLGLPGGAIYKAINTADSMIGHKTERHLHFGWAAARLDDLVNLPASRLSMIWLVIAAAFMPGVSASRAWKTAWRDARAHRSPNAGWPEAAMAGALGLKLNGPRVYGETRVDDVYMGDGNPNVGPADIWNALALYRRACAVQWCVAIVLLVVLVQVSG